MRYFLSLLTCALFSFEGFSAERNVVVPIGDTRFSVEMDDIVRLKGESNAGSRIEIKIKNGLVKIEHANNVREMVDGKVNIGNFVKEFDLKPTGKGKEEVEIVVIIPGSNLPRVKKKYFFEIK